MPVRTSFGKRFMDFFFPRECVVCGKRLATASNVICMACNLRLPRTGFQLQPEDNEMAKLFWRLIPIEKAAALFFYQPNSATSNIIRQLKYKGNRSCGYEMGRIMAYDFTDHGFFDGIDAIIPVPISRKRKIERGYNQSQVIASGVASVTGLPIITDAVKRPLFHESQTQKHFLERKENVKDAFSLNNGSRIKGKHLLIIDDVVTTGATVTACAEELMKGGAESFSVLSIGFTRS